MVVGALQDFGRILAIYVYRRISVTDNNGFLTIYGHRASLLNNNYEYVSSPQYCSDVEVS